MSGFSLPVSRPAGHALLIGAAEGRAPSAAYLSALHFTFDEADEPYSGFAHWCADPSAYAAVVLCLGGLFQEELDLIATLKRIQPTVDVWLSQTDGRHAAMAAALGLGADGLLSEAGLHRIALAPAARAAPEVSPGSSLQSRPQDVHPDPLPEASNHQHNGEAVLPAAALAPDLDPARQPTDRVSDQSDPHELDHEHGTRHNHDHEPEHEHEHDSYSHGLPSCEPLLTADELSALLDEPALAPRGEGV